MFQTEKMRTPTWTWTDIPEVRPNYRLPALWIREVLVLELMEDPALRY